METKIKDITLFKKKNSRSVTVDISRSKYYIDKELHLKGIIYEEKKLEEEYKEIWRRYAYYAIFRSGIPLDFLHYPDMYSYPYTNIDKLEDLYHGKNVNLDIICDGILNKTRFLIDN